MEKKGKAKPVKVVREWQVFTRATFLKAGVMPRALISSPSLLYPLPSLPSRAATNLSSPEGWSALVAVGRHGNRTQLAIMYARRLNHYTVLRQC